MADRTLGTVCRLSPYDTPATVEPGDYVLTAAGTSAYLVTAARRMASRHPDRWALTCLRVAPETIPADATVHPLHWYPRVRRG